MNETLIEALLAAKMVKHSYGRLVTNIINTLQQKDSRCLCILGKTKQKQSHTIMNNLVNPVN